MAVRFFSSIALFQPHPDDPKQITIAGVQYILDSVISEMMKNDSRLFSYCETGYFWRWWREQDFITKSTVKHFVKEGSAFLRLQFAHKSTQAVSNSLAAGGRRTTRQHRIM